MNKKNSLNVLLMRVFQIPRRRSGTVSTVCHPSHGLVLFLEDANSLPKNKCDTWTFTLFHNTQAQLSDHLWQDYWSVPVIS